MSVTDQALVNESIYSLLENGNADAAETLLTTMFTVQGIVEALNRAQNQFLRDTGMVVTRAPIASIVNVGKYDLPQDSVMVRRVVWKTTTPTQTGYGQQGYGVGPYGGSENAIRSVLTEADTWELDHGIPDWPSDFATPLAWWQTTLPQQRLGIAKAPDDVGALEILYVALGQTLDGTGVSLTISDDWTPYVKWLALADLLGRDGEASDPVRAEYCNTRYQEGVELARLVLMG